MRIERNDAFCAKIAVQMLSVQLAQPFVGFLVMGEGTHVKGMLVVNDVANGNAEITVQSVKAVGRSLSFVVFARMLFQEMRCTRVTARTRPSNRWAVNALESMGFRHEGTARHWYRDGDPAVIYGLLASEQRICK